MLDQYPMNEIDKPPASLEPALTRKLEALPLPRRRVILLLVIFFETSKRELLQIAVDQLVDYVLNHARQSKNTRRQYPS
jgi:hypothetical protein